MLRAADVMTQEPVTILPTSSVVEAERILEQLAIRHLPVVDSMGELVGMLSDRDLRAAMTSRSELEPAVVSRSASVVDFMSSNVITAEADDDLIAIADLMVDNTIGAVPIVDERGLLLGIVSYVDILKSLATIADDDHAPKAATKKPATKKPAKPVAKPAAKAAPKPAAKPVKKAAPAKKAKPKSRR